MVQPFEVEQEALLSSVSATEHLKSCFKTSLCEMKTEDQELKCQTSLTTGTSHAAQSCTEEFGTKIYVQKVR